MKKFIFLTIAAFFLCSLSSNAQTKLKELTPSSVKLSKRWAKVPSLMKARTIFLHWEENGFVGPKPTMPAGVELVYVFEKQITAFQKLDSRQSVTDDARYLEPGAYVFKYQGYFHYPYCLNRFSTFQAFPIEIVEVEVEKPTPTPATTSGSGSIFADPHQEEKKKKKYYMSQEEAADILMGNQLSPCMETLKMKFPLEFPLMLRIKKQLEGNPFISLKQARRLFREIKDGKARRAFYRCQGYTWWQINRARIGYLAAGVVAGSAAAIYGSNTVPHTGSGGVTIPHTGS